MDDAGAGLSRAGLDMVDRANERLTHGPDAPWVRIGALLFCLAFWVGVVLAIRLNGVSIW